MNVEKWPGKHHNFLGIFGILGKDLFSFLNDAFHSKFIHRVFVKSTEAIVDYFEVMLIIINTANSVNRVIFGLDRKHGFLFTMRVNNQHNFFHEFFMSEISDWIIGGLEWHIKNCEFDVDHFEERPKITKTTMKKNLIIESIFIF